MKKLIQLSLVVIFVLVLFQTMAAGSVAASHQSELGIARNISSRVSSSTEGVAMAVCFSGIKGVICVMPQVGWNS